MNEKLISIIVPIYNTGNLLERTFESILNQTYKNIEIIAVDDGSTDETGEILDEIAKSDSRIVVVHQENGGVTSARNHGIALAKGDYIGFCDSDDIIEKKMYEILVKNMEENDVDISHCGYQMVFPSRVDYYYNTGKSEKSDNKKGVYELIDGSKVEPSIVNKLYKKELFSGVEIPDDVRINEDVLVNFLLFKKAESSFFVDLPLYHYMLRKGSAATSQGKREKFSDPIKVDELIFEETTDDEKLHNAAYVRLVRALIFGICQSNFKDISKSSKDKLKKYLKENIQLPKKEKYMAILALHFLPAFRFLKFIHSKITGNDKKYNVE